MLEKLQYITPLLAAIFPVLTAFFVGSFLDRSSIWRTRKEQFEDIIATAEPLLSQTTHTHADRIRFEGALFNKYGSGLNYQAVLFVMKRPNSPKNMECLARTREYMVFRGDGFSYTRQGVVGWFLKPIESREKLYTSIGYSIAIIWSAFTWFCYYLITPASTYPEGIRSVIILWLVTSGLLFWIVYDLASLLRKVRSAKSLLELPTQPK